MHFGLNLISWLLSNLIQYWRIAEFLMIELTFIFSVSTSFDTASKMTMKLSAIFWKSPMSPKKSWQTSRSSWACQMDGHIQYTDPWHFLLRKAGDQKRMSGVVYLGCSVLVQHPDPVQIVKVHSSSLQSLPCHHDPFFPTLSISTEHLAQWLSTVF